MLEVNDSQAPPPRVGLLVPSCNNVVESDFQRAFMGAVSLHGARMWSGDACEPDAHVEMNREAEQAAKYVGSAGVDVLAYCCTAGSFGAGLDAAERQRADLSTAAGGVPCVTAAGSVLQSLRSLGVSKVAVLTPYSEDENERLAGFLSDGGVTPTSIMGRGYVSNTRINQDSPAAIRDFVRSSPVTAVDAVFLSCTNWRAFDVIDELEVELRVPIVTSNSALIWAVSMAVHVPPAGDRPGRLLHGLAA